jgi:hypothetical protein
MLKPVPYRCLTLAHVLLFAGCAGTKPDGAPSGSGGELTSGTSGAGSGGTTSAAGMGTGAVAGASAAGGGGGGTGGVASGDAGKTGAAGAVLGGAGAAAGGQAGFAGAHPDAGAGTGGANLGGAGSTGNAGAGSTLPPLHVEGPAIKDPNGKTIVLRGFDVPDLGTLYAGGGQNVSGITARIDKALASGLTGHVVRLAVYPRTTFNSGFPFYSPVPYPVGPAAPSGMHQELSEAEYIAKLLEPAVDYARDHKLYAIIDYHQIDDAAGQSGTDAVSFWTTVAPAFASYDNVIFEPYNEPIDTKATWADFKPTVQSFITAIRAAAPNNLIIVPSMNWDQRPGDAAGSPPSGTNLVYTAHVYPGNWTDGFKQQVATAAAVAPVFFSEWGDVLTGTDKNLGTADANWGADFQALVDADGASWSAWVADGSWTPNLFTNQSLSSLSPFGMFTASWLASKATSDWVF